MSSRKNIPQIIAMKHLPSNPCTLEALSKNSLFITDDFDVEELKENPNSQKFMQIISVWMASLGKSIFEGVYSPTKKNPIYLMEAFQIFHQQGIYPPVWILDWLNDAFSAYFKSKGERSLDSLLGIKRGKGQTPVFKEASNTDKESKIMLEISGLTLLGISAENAAFMVSSRLQSMNIKCPTVETLTGRYVKRGWRKISEIARDNPPEISDDAKKAIVRQYPDYSIPAKLRATFLV